MKDQWGLSLHPAGLRCVFRQLLLLRGVLLLCPLTLPGPFAMVCDVKPLPQGKSSWSRVEKEILGDLIAADHLIALLGAAGPDDDHDGGDDLPVDPENNMEVTPAANEHIEPQRVGQAGFSRALEPGCPAAHCLTLLLCLPECAPGERLRAAAASPC